LALVGLPSAARRHQEVEAATSRDPVPGRVVVGTDEVKLHSKGIPDGAKKAAARWEADRAGDADAATTDGNGLDAGWP
jgi:hypothetical protein